MTTLAEIRDMLQSTTDTIENVIALDIKLNQSYEELMSTAKAAEVAGLHRPNVFPMIQQLKEQKEALDSLKFAVECHMEDAEKSIEKAKEDRWAECIKKIPQKDEFELEGIKNWRISQFAMIPNSAGLHEKSFREEAYKLLASGFDLAFNTDHGVGSIRKANDDIIKDGFFIEFWQDLKKKDIYKKTLDEVLDWIIYFYDNEDN